MPFSRAPGVPLLRRRLGNIPSSKLGTKTYQTQVGVSRDAAGAIRGNCRVVLLRTFDDVKVAETISGPDGTYRIEVSGDPGPCYVVSRVAIDPV